MNRWLAALAAALGASALLVGAPPSAPGGEPLAAGGVFPGAPREPGRVSVLEVARWIRDREPDLHLIDLRSTEEFEDFHLPRAEQVDDLRATGIDVAERVVLYAESPEAARRAWREAREAGYEGALFLADGVAEWLREIMSPRLSPDASAAERAAFDKVAQLSRYFGGLPRVATADELATEDDADASSLLQRTRRRGCAF